VPEATARAALPFYERLTPAICCLPPRIQCAGPPRIQHPKPSVCQSSGGVASTVVRMQWPGAAIARMPLLIPPRPAMPVHRDFSWSLPRVHATHAAQWWREELPGVSCERGCSRPRKCGAADRGHWCSRQERTRWGRHCGVGRGGRRDEGSRRGVARGEAGKGAHLDAALPLGGYPAGQALNRSFNICTACARQSDTHDATAKQPTINAGCDENPMMCWSTSLGRRWCIGVHRTVSSKRRRPP
jgi:hypothetical protein